MKKVTRHGWPIRPAGDFYLADEYRVEDDDGGWAILPVDRWTAVYNLEGRTGRDAETIWIGSQPGAGWWQVEWHIQLGDEEEWDGADFATKKEAIEFVRDLMWTHYTHRSKRGRKK